MKTYTIDNLLFFFFGFVVTGKSRQNILMEAKKASKMSDQKFPIG